MFTQTLHLKYMKSESYYSKHIDCFQPKAVFFTCIDSRMIPTRFTQTNVGDMFIGKFI